MNEFQVNNLAKTDSDLGVDFITNRNYKDGVFTSLFSDEEKICELYNALKDTDKYKASDIQIQTLENALYKLYKDDLAFSVGDSFVILTEHQSTPCENMPIRMLIYIARVYERLLDKRIVYGNTMVKIPTPELYVLYNGLEEWGDNLTLKLSDAFAANEGDSENQFLEVRVKVININLQKHNAVLDKSHTLKEYSVFIDTIRGCLNKGYTRDEAIEYAIKDCISRGILSEFLTKHGGEIYNMIFQEFNMETALDVAKSEGEFIGLAKGRLEAAKNMKKEGFPKDVIARVVGLDSEVVETL